ncbi:MAG: hypothetical protein Q9214_003538 [Letrouitia sp. 1 TL-2023]
MQLHSIVLHLSVVVASALSIAAAPSNDTNILEPREDKVSCRASARCDDGTIDSDLKNFRDKALLLLDDQHEYNGNSKGESGVCVRGCSDNGFFGNLCISKHAMGLFVKGKGCKRTGAEMKELVAKISDNCPLCGGVHYERNCQLMEFKQNWWDTDPITFVDHT